MANCQAYIAAITLKSLKVIGNGTNE